MDELTPVIRCTARPSCHLCEEAEAILARGPTRPAAPIQKVDITARPTLFEQFRYRIPVIEVAGGQTLDWPTTPERVRRAILAATSPDDGAAAYAL